MAQSISHLWHFDFVFVFIQNDKRASSFEYVHKNDETFWDNTEIVMFSQFKMA